MKAGPAKDYLSMYELQEGGCWRFTGSFSKENNYGRCRNMGAHRYFYLQLVGPIPRGLHVDHKCHIPSECHGGPTCPHRRCVKPAHLAVVTPRENVLRSNSSAAHNANATNCPEGHPYSGSNLVVLKKQRTCRICSRRRDAKHKVIRAKRVVAANALHPIHEAILSVLRHGPASDIGLAAALGISRQRINLFRGDLVRSSMVIRAASTKTSRSFFWEVPE